MNDAAQPILIGSATSPFVRKVRMCLHAKAIPHRFETLSAWDPAGGIEQLNPLAKVPVLRIAPDDLLFDSRVIVQYLETTYPALPLLPAGGLARIGALRIEALADGIGDATALAVQEGWRRTPSAAWHARQQAKVEQGLRALERTWAARDVTADAAATLAGIATAAAIGFARLWLPALVDALAMPAIGHLEARMTEYAWFDATRPMLPRSATFPVF